MSLLQTAGQPCQRRRSPPSGHAVRTLAQSRLPVVLALVAAVLFPWPAQAQAPDKYQPLAYGRSPLTFEDNTGQADPGVKFLSRGSGYILFLTGGS